MVKENLADELAQSMNNIVDDKNYQKIFTHPIKTASKKMSNEKIIKGAFDKLLKASVTLDKFGLSKSSSKVLKVIAEILDDTGVTKSMTEEQLGLAAQQVLEPVEDENIADIIVTEE